MTTRVYKYELLIVLFSLALFVPFLGAVHLFDWDEINFAEAAREMIVTGDYFKVQINYQPFWEKPPLFIWMQAASMHVFGINEFAARFPNAIAGAITLLSVFRIGKKIFNVEFGLIWSIVYAGTFLTFIYFKSGIIDPWFNLFIFLSIYYFSFLTLSGSDKRKTNALLSGFFLGLAILTKGPVALLIALLCLTTYYIITRFKNTIKISEFLIITLVCITVCFAWFGVELVKNGSWFLREFILYQIRLFKTEDAGHGGPFFYHWIVLLIGCFPASVFMIKSFFVRGSILAHQRNFYYWMSILFWIVLVLFSIVRTKIVHYSSLCYFPLTFMAAYALWHLANRKTNWNKWLTWSVWIIGLLMSILFIAFPFFMKYKENWITLIKDDFAVANLQAVIDWDFTDTSGGFILLIGLFLLHYYQRKENYRVAIVCLFSFLTLSVLATSVLIVPKIELFSQGAAIRFYKRVKNENVYVQPMYFKSYAHLFYTQKKPITNPSSFDHEWLRSGPIDKPVYIIVKVNKASELKKYNDIRKIGEENGFIFYKREPVK